MDAQKYDVRMPMCVGACVCVWEREYFYVCGGVPVCGYVCMCVCVWISVSSS